MLSFLMAVQTDFIFRRYSVDGGEDCKKFALVPAWYYDRSNEDCQPYKVCANKDILFHERCGISSAYVFSQNCCLLLFMLLLLLVAVVDAISCYYIDALKVPHR